MLTTQTRIEFPPTSRRARRDRSPNRRNASPAREDESFTILFDAEAPTPPRQDALGPSGGQSSPDGDRSTIGAYLQDLRRYSLMTRDDEHGIAVRFRATADPRLAAQLVTANLRLVVKIAKEYRQAHNNLSDLVQEGNVGLVHAVHKYDPSRGVKLSSYASWWVRAYILNFVMSNYRLVKLGTTQAQRKLFFNLRKQREKLERQGFEVQPKQLAAALDVTEDEVIEMEQRLDASEAPIDTPTSGGSRRPPHDVVAPPDARPDVSVEMSEFNTIVVDKLNTFGATLHGRDLEIFHERLLNDEPMSLVDLAARFGVSAERVRQLESRLKGRLRTYLENEIGDVEVDDVANLSFVH